MISAGTVLLHDNAPNAGRSLLFENPRRVLTTRNPADVPALLGEAEAAIGDGRHLAGFLSYELGFCFEERLVPLLASARQMPLVWLGVYDAPVELDREAAWAWLAGHSSPAPSKVGKVSLSMSREEYDAAFANVMEYIRAGDVYQINLTMLARFGFSGDPVSFYRELCRSQPVSFGALVNTGEDHVLSLSPELFIENRAGRIVTRPMKGTAPRGTTPEDDEAIKAAMQADEKSRAENLMIVDLLRNDLGRVAETGSVEVPALFEIETYKSLHQMTSTVAARLKPGAGLGAVLRALFPCGSVTGAPKIRAMQIIGEIESRSRGVYCGSIGHVAPNGDFSFNVAIRTAVIHSDGRGEIGIGGGIVADSVLNAEYEECLLKLGFFREAAIAPGLIETLLWKEVGGFWLLERHLERLEKSAGYFGMTFDRAAIMVALDAVVRDREDLLRVRLVLAPDGGVETVAVPLPPTEKLSFLIATQVMDSTDPLLAHKTTRRAVYDQPRAEAAKLHGVDEVVFVNERGELTEGSFTNLFVEKHGILLTPPLSSGLLPGVLRAELIATGQASESVLRPADLRNADAIFLGNSVRGLVTAVLVG
ncbi:aminodeoxychorismate synthase component I [Flaviflagellibacter deserti]|uniref:Probable branched-chain-amino-acid aminotransferase n=1 Tax=Flaviflagellibacter deserti TaxID=2267266 RepID=A0ABV9Z7L1_9HYPH